MRVVIYNDTFKNTRPHFGCDLVMSTFREQLDRVGVELLGTIPMADKTCNDPILEKADLVIVNGEGSFHHNRRNDIAKVSERYNSILINTVFEDNNVDVSKFKFISARESKSASLLGCEVIPDIIFTSKRLQDIVLTGKNNHGKLMHFSGNMQTLQPADKLLPQLANCSTLDTESFHGVAVATILGIKINKVLPGSGVTWKTLYLHKDIRENPNYVEDARTKINGLFDRLHEFV